MKPRIFWRSGEWLCNLADRESYIGWGSSPLAAYEMWAWCNRNCDGFIPSYSKEDNQDQTRRET